MLGNGLLINNQKVELRGITTNKKIIRTLLSLREKGFIIKKNHDSQFSVIVWEKIMELYRFFVICTRESSSNIYSLNFQILINNTNNVNLDNIASITSGIDLFDRNQYVNNGDEIGELIISKLFHYFEFQDVNNIQNRISKMIKEVQQKNQIVDKFKIVNDIVDFELSFLIPLLDDLVSETLK